MSNTANIPRLKENAVGLWGNYAQAMAVTAPLGSVVQAFCWRSVRGCKPAPRNASRFYNFMCVDIYSFMLFLKNQTRLAGSIHIAQTA